MARRDGGLELYRRNANEAEARAVADRLDMTDAERFGDNFSAVPKDDLIVQTDDGGVRAMSLDPERALETIKKFDDVLRGNRRITKLEKVDAALAQRIEQETGIRVKSGASIELTNRNAIHIHNRHIVNPDEARPLGDADIAALPEVIKDPDTITRERVVRGAQRIKFTRNIDGDKMAVAEVIKKGDALNVVTYFNDSPSYRPNKSMSISEDIRPKRDTSESLNGSIANPSDNVKPKMTRELRTKVDEVIYDRQPELFHNYDENNMRPLGEGGETEIPRLHVERIFATTSGEAGVESVPDRREL